MIRKRLILSVLIAAVIAIATLSLSSCDVFDSEEPEYYPDRIIFRFHDEYGNFLEDIPYENDGTPPLTNRQPAIPEKEYYDFMGFFAGALDDPKAKQVVRSDGRINTITDYAAFVASPTPIDEANLDLHARFRKKEYVVAFAYDSSYTLLGGDGLNYYYDCHLRIHPDEEIDPSKGYFARRDDLIFYGWRTEGGEVAFDESFAPVMDSVRLSALAEDYYEAHNAPENERRYLRLYPIFGTQRYTLTLDYADPALKNGSEYIYDGDELSELKLPEGIAASGKYLLGWSLSASEYIKPSGKVCADTTLYAVWTPAKELSLSLLGETRKAYLFPNGGIVYDRPEGAEENYGILGIYADEAMTLPISDFELATEGMKAYAKWGKSVKTVYLYPNNGDAMLQITVHSEVQKNDFEMPTFDGYVIAGIYEDSSLEGDSVTLDFESVTDGASYYIKWESE